MSETFGSDAPDISEKQEEVSTSQIGGAPRQTLSPEAPPEDVVAFWAELGKPDTADGYELSPGDSATGYDIDLSDWFRQAAHDANMPANMAKSLHDAFRDHMAAQADRYWQAIAQKRDESEAILRRDWGAGFEGRMQDARRAIERFGGQSLKDTLNDTGLGDHPLLVRAFADMGRLLAGNGGGIPTDEAAAGTPTAVPANATQAQRQILRLRSNADFMAAYGDRTHPNHAIAQDQMDEFYALAYPAAVVQQ